MDKIVVDLDTDQRECVACGFSEARPGDQPVAAKPVLQDIPTRVNRPAARRVETPAEPVRLVDPAAGDDS
jgi:Zn ribbon nucleic-acid-binding protein